MFQASDGQSGSRLAANLQPDVIILGLELPDMTGVAWVQSFREWSQIPVLALSVRERVTDGVAALENGANAYLVKPFDTAELLARLRVLQRCWPGVPEGSFLTGDGFNLNPDAREVEVAVRPLKFTATEEALFYLLVQHAGKIVTCEHLLRSIWGNDSKNKLHELQVLIGRIRKKLEAGGNRIKIHTAGRAGYQLFVAVANDRASASV